MKRSIQFAFLVVFFVVSPAHAAAEHPDFSGSYKIKSVKGEDKPDESDTWTLRVTQSDSEIRIVTVTNGHPSTEIFPLSAGETKCKSADGEDAKCTADWNGKTLTLETIYRTHRTENGPEIEMHSRERLQLSPDRKTLTIRSDEKAPRFPNLQMSEPTTEIYIRNERP